MCMELNGCYGDTPFLPLESSGQTKSHNSHSRRHVITTPAMQGGAVAVMRRENNSEQTEQGAVLAEETVKMDSAAGMGLA